MVWNCQKWHSIQRNQLVLLHFLCYFFGFVALIATADQSSSSSSSSNKNANQTAEIKTKLLKIIQKGNLLEIFNRIHKISVLHLFPAAAAKGQTEHRKHVNLFTIG